MKDNNKLRVHNYQGKLNGMPCIIDAIIAKNGSGLMKIAGTAIVKAVKATAMPALDTLAELSFTWNDKIQRPRVAISSWEYNRQSDEFEAEFASDPLKRNGVQ